jgi:hypothetical protein
MDFVMCGHYYGLCYFCGLYYGLLLWTLLCYGIICWYIGMKYYYVGMLV